MATGNEWLTGSDWTGGTAPGETGNAASTNSEIAVFNDYSSSTIPASGLGIDMTAATGHLALGAIELNSDSGTLRIGNSSTTDNGLLRLNGATTTAGAGTIIDVSGSSDLVLADAPDASNPSGTTLGVTLGSSGSQVSIAPGRTVTITSAIGEAAAGAELSLIGGGRLALGGTNTFSGGTTISAGKLVATSAATFANSAAGMASVCHRALRGLAADR